ncbi:hypothetical protein CQA01_12890 [Cyclobacterium qasimii]|nr:hypothetical protein CQA01_12890 [Cyclobacterium qasimii]
MNCLHFPWPGPGIFSYINKGAGLGLDPEGRIKPFSNKPPDNEKALPIIDGSVMSLHKDHQSIVTIIKERIPSIQRGLALNRTIKFQEIY